MHMIEVKICLEKWFQTLNNPCGGPSSKNSAVTQDKKVKNMAGITGTNRKTFYPVQSICTSGSINMK